MHVRTKLCSHYTNISAHEKTKCMHICVTSQLLNNGHFPDADRDFTRWTSREVTSLSRAATANANLSSDFTVEEIEAAIKKLKSGKAPGRDNIHPEFVIHQSAKTTAWLYSFFKSCYRRSKLPKTWRHATVVALPKPNKPAQDPKSYRPISLLCVPFKILGTLIHSHIDPVVDPQPPREQAGFRRGRSTVDQVTLLTQDTEHSFQHNEKVGVVFLDLTAAYDTVWHRGRHLKLLRIIPDRHMVGFIMEMSNRSFVVHTSDGQRSRLRRMKSRRVPSSHRCCLTSISAIFRKQHLGSTVMLTTWPSYCDAHLGRKWKRVSTKT